MKQEYQGLLRYRSDRRTLVFTVLTLILLLLPLGLTLPTWLQFLWVMVSGLFCFNACIINHNHVHSPVFVSSRLNSLFGIFLSLLKGHSSTGIIQAHNDNHHIHQGSPEDWIRPGLAGKGPGILRLFRYVPMAMVSMAKGRRHGATITDPLQRDRMLLERVSLAAFILLLIYTAGLKAVIFIGIPWALGICMLIAVNLLQHDCCEANSDYLHSRNFTGRLGNWFFFNNGFHTIHHIDPGRHWSELAEVHERDIRPQIPAHLQQSSILAYLFSGYLFNFADRDAAPRQEQV